MKPIKCPNCGKRMKPERAYARRVARAKMECPGCGMQGPAGDAATERGAAIVAARLMREWIARMEADKSGRWIDGYNEGWEEAKKDVHNTHDACVHQDGWIKGNRAAVSEMRVIIEKIEASMKRVEEGGK